jgi:hypothetical protein
MLMDQLIAFELNDADGGFGKGSPVDIVEFTASSVLADRE